MHEIFSKEQIYLILLSFIIWITSISASATEERKRQIRLTIAKNTAQDLGVNPGNENIVPLSSRRIETKIIEIETQRGRQLSEDELKSLIQEALTGRSIVRKSCFTCRMRVSTPNGLVPIEEIQIGDEVYSWDEASKSLVVNRVRVLAIVPDQIFGQAHSEAALLPIEVTPSHRFYLPQENDYLPISQIPHGSPLFILHQPGTSTCQQILSPLDSYIEAVGQGTVFNLSLEREPFNYFVEGVLVHNVKGGI